MYTHTHTHTPTITCTHTHKHTPTITCTHAHKHTPTITCTHTHTNTLPLSHAHTHTHTHTHIAHYKGIVYCLSRKDSDQVSIDLCQKGIKAGCYHADLPASEKTRIHTQWLQNKTQVCST